MGLPAVPPDRVRRLVGHGLEKLVAQVAGAERAEEGVRLFRRRYPEVAVAKSALMDGVPEVLAALAARGLALALASNKPPDYSRLILEAKGIAPFFAVVEGPGPETLAKPDPAMLADAMRRTGASPETTVAVGDMEVDAEFARAAGCAVVLVPKGSRTRAELEGVGADALLPDLRELPGWIDARRRAR
jgi:phosphoglycolate phosphatase